MRRQRYALVTPARNEEACIQQTIEAVLAQTILPFRWIIVSDGSVDQTDNIVARFAREHSFIRFVKTGQRGEKDFGSKARAFHTGYEELKDTPYDFLGNLDADVTLQAHYYERMLEYFAANPKLGVAAGGVRELIGDRYVTQDGSLNSAAGSVQLFRRECYESFGGYVPIKGGGIDAAAEIMARMRGWEVRTFPDVPVFHNRRMTTGSRTVLTTRFRSGATNYALGYHPLFHVAACVSRANDRPYLLGSVSSLLGYGWSWLRRSKRAVPGEVVRFLQAEQLERLISAFMVRGHPRRSAE
jgi:poly-beta-1,6-N-acetyl-D-glucosamine synthase